MTQKGVFLAENDPKRGVFRGYPKSDPFQKCAAGAPSKSKSAQKGVFLAKNDPKRGVFRGVPTPKVTLFKSAQRAPRQRKKGGQKGVQKGCFKSKMTQKGVFLAKNDPKRGVLPQKVTFSKVRSGRPEQVPKVTFLGGYPKGGCPQK